MNKGMSKESVSRWFASFLLVNCLFAATSTRRSYGAGQWQAPPASDVATLDLRAPMALAANAIPARLDATRNYRPWFMLRGSNNIPTSLEHASWDLGDMTGRYLEGLILARRMGVSAPQLSHAEERLSRYLMKLIGKDGLIHDP